MTRRLGIRSVRADVSALLLIAFVFQLLWPIAALSADAFSEEYEAKIRNSICQVVLEETDKGTPSEVTDLLCDWCVLCDSPMATGLNGLSISAHEFLSAPSEISSAYGFRPTEFYFSFLSAPRAPPTGPDIL